MLLSLIILIILFFSSTKESLNFYWLILFLILITSIGGLRYLISGKASLIKFNPNNKIELYGFIADTNKKSLIVKSIQIAIKDKIIPFKYKVMVRQYKNRSHMNIGDYVYLSGNMVNTERIYFNKFNYGKLLKNKGIDYLLYLKNGEDIRIISKRKKFLLKRSFDNLRTAIATIFDTYFATTNSKLLKALLLGIRENFPDEIYTDFKKTGTAHILAISGLHVGIIGYLVYLLFSLIRVKHRYVYLCTILVLIAYCILTGMRVSVTRATFLAVVYLFGLFIERESNSLNSLGLVGTILLLINPNDLFSPGYLLSFAAVISILSGMDLFKMILPHTHDHFHSKLKTIYINTYSYMFSIFLISLFAWLGVLPIIAYFFNIITPGGIICNLYTIPLTFLIIAAGVFIPILHFILPQLASIFGLSLDLFIFLNNSITHYFAQLPFICFEIKYFSLWSAFLYYVFIASLMVSISLAIKKGLSRRTRP
ncbi:MAG: ComEC/Rec2 family competence protein [bacterium]